MVILTKNSNFDGTLLKLGIFGQIAFLIKGEIGYFELLDLVELESFSMLIQVEHVQRLNKMTRIDEDKLY